MGPKRWRNRVGRAFFRPPIFCPWAVSPYHKWGVTPCGFHHRQLD